MTTYVVTDYDGCDYITAGKQYEAKRNGGCFYITNDEGQISNILAPNCAHLNGNSWTVIEEPDAPKTWGEMTDAEKGALLLAHHEGKVIEIFGWASDDSWHAVAPQWASNRPYRIKPEPVVGVKRMPIRLSENGDLYQPASKVASTILTLPTLDGQIVTGEFANEDGMKVVIEEKQK